MSKVAEVEVGVQRLGSEEQVGTSSHSVSTVTSKTNLQRKAKKKWHTSYDPAVGDGDIDVGVYVNDQLLLEENGNDMNPGLNVFKNLKDQVIMYGAPTLGIQTGASSFDYSTLKPGHMLSDTMLEASISRTWSTSSEQDSVVLLPMRVMMEISKYSQMSAELDSVIGLPRVETGPWPRLINDNNIFRTVNNEGSKYLVGVSAEKGHFIVIIVTGNDNSDKLEVTVLDSLGFTNSSGKAKTIFDYPVYLRGIISFMVDLVKEMGKKVTKHIIEVDYKVGAVPQQTGVNNCGPMATAMLRGFFSNVEGFSKVRNMNTEDAWRTYLNLNVEKVRSEMLEETLRYIDEDSKEGGRREKIIKDLRLTEQNGRFLSPSRMQTLLSKEGSSTYIAPTMGESESDVVKDSFPIGDAPSTQETTQSAFPQNISSDTTVMICAECGTVSNGKSDLLLHMSVEHPGLIENCFAMDDIPVKEVIAIESENNEEKNPHNCSAGQCFKGHPSALR